MAAWSSATHAFFWSKRPSCIVSHTPVISPCTTMNILVVGFCAWLAVYHSVLTKVVMNVWLNQSVPLPPFFHFLFASLRGPCSLVDREYLLCDPWVPALMVKCLPPKVSTSLSVHTGIPSLYVRTAIVMSCLPVCHGP